MKIKTPVTVGTYDDAGMICDADGNELFSVGQNEDTHEMFPKQAELAKEVMACINRYTALQMHADMLQLKLTQKQHVIDRQTKENGGLRWHLERILDGCISHDEHQSAGRAAARGFLRVKP